MVPGSPRRPSTWPWHLVGPVLVYLALVVAGVTQSSIGILQEKPDHLHSPMLLRAQALRTDEFLTSTPIQIAAAVTGRTDLTNPLSAPQNFLAELPAGPVSSVVLFDGTLMRVGDRVPPQVLVAQRWWLPFLLLVLGAPAYFRMVTGSRRIGWFAVVLFVLNPMSAWWSFTPIQALGLVTAGTASVMLGVAAADAGRRAAACSWCLVGAVLLARTPLTYQPWALVVVPPLLLAGVLAAWTRAEHKRRAALVLVASGALCAALVGGMVLEYRDAIDAAAATYYPGRRVSTGSPNPFENLFGATNLASLLLHPHIRGGDEANASEISSAYTVVLIWAAVLAFGRPRLPGRGHRRATATIAVTTVFWMAWCTIPFGTLGSHLPLVNLVPSYRATSALGLLAATLLCFLLPATRDHGSAWLAGTAAVLTSGFAAVAGVLLRARDIPSMSLLAVVVSSVLLGATVYLCTRWPRRAGGYVLGGVLAFALVGLVNPVLVGLGDLHDSRPAQQMLAAGDAARRDGDLWASDDIAVDALLMATGVPSLSGRQLTGPDPRAWRQLDPDPAAEPVWNRGTALVRFRWVTTSAIRLSSPRDDLIFVTTSPCTVRAREPRLTRVISSRPLTDRCLRLDREFDWSLSRRYVYRFVS